MKLGLIGNMNNINFCVMRYLRDLGVDAYLLLYSNDGTDSLSHFMPEDDTWNYSKWEKYIVRTEIRNNFRTLLPAFLPIPSALSSAEIAEHLTEYDKLVGTGLAPAIVTKAGRYLNIFFPYSVGVEFVYATEFVNSARGKGIHKKLLYSWIRKKQIKGIQNSKIVLNGEQGLTQKVLDQIGANSKSLPLPMVYNNEDNPIDLDGELGSYLNLIRQCDLSIIYHSRQFWKRPQSYTDLEWSNVTKNTDWLITSFAKIVKEYSDRDIKLFLLEYGPDIEDSKRLISELGIEEMVIWLPKMSRKYLLKMIEESDLGVGAFMSGKHLLWGGAGWEIMSQGTALLQTFGFEEKEFEHLYNHPSPPYLKANSPLEVEKELAHFVKGERDYDEIGKKLKDWFNTYNGISLAKQWLEILKSSDFR